MTAIRKAMTFPPLRLLEKRAHVAEAAETKELLYNVGKTQKTKAAIFEDLNSYILKDDPSQASSLITRIHTLNLVNDEGLDPLMVLVKRASLTVIKATFALFSTITHVNKKHEDWTFLHYLATSQHAESFKFILRKIPKHDYDVIDRRGRTPLDIAIVSGHKHIADLLKEAGAHTAEEIIVAGGPKAEQILEKRAAICSQIAVGLFRLSSDVKADHVNCKMRVHYGFTYDEVRINEFLQILKNAQKKEAPKKSSMDTATPVAAQIHSDQVHSEDEKSKEPAIVPDDVDGFVMV
jgi:hypothetical protein